MTVPAPARSRTKPGSRGAPSRASNSLPSFASLTGVDRGVVEALAYADVFDWPLRAAEIHRYLPVEATPGEVESALGSGAPSSHLIERTGDLAMLRGRDELAGVRQQAGIAFRGPVAASDLLGSVVGRLPFVRMVAVTGSLAVDAADDVADVDFMVVTEDGRVWLTRALAMGIVRAATIGGLRLCPNYLLADIGPRIDDRTLFTAHELAQMVPIVPSPTYDELLRQNAWYRDFLPER